MKITKKYHFSSIKYYKVILILFIAAEVRSSYSSPACALH